MLKRLMVTATAIATSLACGTALAQSYEFIEIGTLGGTTSSATSINQSGHVTGSSMITGNVTRHAILWDGVALLDLGTLGGDYSEGLAINDSDKVAGISKTFFGFLHATLWSGAVKTDLGMVDNPSGTGAVSYANGIGDDGKVVGSGQTADYYRHATLWKNPTEMKDIDKSDKIVQSDASAINAQGTIVGWMSTTSGSMNPRHAFKWVGSTYAKTDLGTLGGVISYAKDVNDVGHIVGSSQTAGSSNYHAVRWTGAAPAIDLGTLGGANSHAYAINSAGVIVGSSQVQGSSAYHAALWNGTQAIDLNALLDPVTTSAGWILESARDINDDGWIVGDARNDALGIWRGVLLKPTVSTSGAFSELGYGMAGWAGVPQLAGAGTLVPGEPCALDLTFAAPAAPALLLVGTASNPTPFLGGTLVPIPYAVSLLLNSDPTGRLLLQFDWPLGLSQGTSLYFQYIVSDAAAIQGASLSTVLRADVP